MFLAWVVAGAAAARPELSVSANESALRVVAVGPTYEYIKGCTDNSSAMAILRANMELVYSCTECPDATAPPPTTPLVCQAQNTGMLEELVNAHGPIAFAHELVLDDTATALHVDKEGGILAEHDAPLDTMTSSRMMPGTDARCATEYCPKGPCVVLEMNYFGNAVMSPKTLDDKENNTWGVVIGETYCGPAAGITLPFAKLLTKKPLPSDTFPQDRPVPALFSPTQQAGIVLPLSAPSNNPDWYYVEGAWGWRTNGVMKKNGLPCYGRTVPRWMLPNVCLKNHPGKGCVNGVSMDALKTDSIQYTDTMVDHALGFNGIYVENRTSNLNVYNFNTDQFHPHPSVHPPLSENDGSFPGAFMMAPFYGLPGSGAHGFSQWPVPQARTGSVTHTLRVPFSSMDSNYLTRLTTSGQTTGMSALPLTYDDGVQQFAEVAAQVSYVNDTLPVSRSMHSHRRLMAFTPKGMISTESYVESGVRVFHHPLFRHAKDVGPRTEYFKCDGNDGCHYGSHQNVYHDKDGNEVNASFIASFINIDQAMVQFGSNVNPPTTPDQTVPILTQFILFGQDTGSFWNVDVHSLNCNPGGSGTEAQSCCLMPASVSSSVRELSGLVKLEYASGYRKSTELNLVDLNTGVSEKVNDWGDQCNELIEEYANYAEYGSETENTHIHKIMTDLDGTMSKFTETLAKYATITQVKGLVYCLHHLSARLDLWNIGRERHRQFYKDGTCQNRKPHRLEDVSSESRRLFFVPSAAMLENIETVRAAPYNFHHNASDMGEDRTLCEHACHVNPERPGSGLGVRSLCADKCDRYWKDHLITPAAVNIRFASKYHCNDKSGYGGRMVKETVDALLVNDGCSTPPGEERTLIHKSLGISMDLFKHSRSIKASKKEQCYDVPPGWVDGPGCVDIFEIATAATHRLLASDGRFMFSAEDMSKLSRTGQGESTHGLARDPVSLLLDATGVGALVMLFAGNKIKQTSTSYSRHHTTRASEGAIDEGVCDLAVCDIARDKARPGEYDSTALRCMPRGYSIAQFAGGAFDDDGSAKGKGDTSCLNTPGKDNWFNAGFAACRLSGNYPFTIAATNGATKAFKRVPADYTTAEDVNTKVKVNHEFKQTPRDAGYSQKHHDKNNNACECNFEGIEMHTEIVTDQTEIERFNVPSVPEYKHSMHKLVQLSLSWVAIRNNAKIGLFMGGTGGQTEWVERDLMYNKADESIIEAADTYDRFLQPSAPLATEHAQAFVYTRVAGNRDVTTDDSPDAAVRGLTNNSYVREWLSVTTSSCVRFPIGVLHRSQMHEDISTAIYGPETDIIKTFDSNTNTLFSPTMQGYCEKVNGRYRFCPGDVFSNAQDRKDFCDAETLASHFIMGVSIRERPLDRRCSPTYKLCVVVPGSPGENHREGLITTHTGVDHEGFTILVTPFNFSALMDMLYDRKLVPMYATDPATHHYLLKDPDTLPSDEMKPVNVTDSTIMGFGSDDDFFTLMSNVEAYIDRGPVIAPENVTDWLRDEIDKGMEKVFEAGKVTGTVDTMKVHAHNMRGLNKAMPSTITCNHGDFWVPEFDHTLPISRQCWTADELYPPHPETGVVVAGEGITIMSASKKRPLRFGGEYPGASTCTRFFMMSRNARVEMEVDQTKCMPRFDTFHSTAVRFLGTNVSGSVVDIQAYAKLADDEVAVSLVGADVEFMKVPTELAANDVTVSIPSDRVGSFDVACARVHGSVTILKPGKKVRVLLQAIEGTDLVLRGNGFPCYDDDFSQTPAEECTFVNVTAYTSLFGSKFEHRAFRRGVKSFTIAWVLLVTLIVVSIVLVAYIVCSNLPTKPYEVTDNVDGDSDT